MADDNYVLSHTGAEVDAAVDRQYLVGSGTSQNGWGYKRWSNGQAEYWITISVTPTSSTQSSSGSGYYSNDIQTPAWPTGLIIASGVTVLATADSSCWCAVRAINESGSSGLSYSIKLRLHRFTEISTESPVTINIHVLGYYQ